MTDGLNQFRRCLICGAASPAECAGGLDPRRTFAEPCGPFALRVSDHGDRWALDVSLAVVSGVTEHPRYGVPPYTPTEAQPTRIGGTEA